MKLSILLFVFTLSILLPNISSARNKGFRVATSCATEEYSVFNAFYSKKSLLKSCAIKRAKKICEAFGYTDYEQELSKFVRTAPYVFSFDRSAEVECMRPVQYVPWEREELKKICIPTKLEERNLDQTIPQFHTYGSCKEKNKVTKGNLPINHAPIVLQIICNFFENSKECSKRAEEICAQEGYGFFNLIKTQEVESRSRPTFTRSYVECHNFNF